MKLLAALLCLSCSPLQLPAQVRCGAVDVAPGIVATAAHCPTYGREVYRDEGADLQLVADQAGGAAAGASRARRRC
jgi:hypothetical protein